MFIGLSTTVTKHLQKVDYLRLPYFINLIEVKHLGLIKILDPLPVGAVDCSVFLFCSIITEYYLHVVMKTLSQQEGDEGWVL